MARQRFRLILLFIGFSGLLSAQETQNSQDRIYTIQPHQKGFVNINAYLMVMDDLSPELPIEEVQKLSQEQEFPYFSPINTMLTGTSSWARLQLINTSQEEYEWLLFTGNNDIVEVYVKQKDGSFTLKKSGSKTPLSEKDIKKGNRSKVLLHLLPHQATEVFINVRQFGQKSPIFDICITNPEAWQQDILGRNLTQGLFQGILWMMIFYSLFITLVSRDLPYLYYSLYLFFCSVFFNYYHYLSAEFLMGDYPWFNYSLWFISGLIPPAYVQFVRTFLNLKKMIPFWDKVAKTLIQVGLFVFAAEIILYAAIRHDQFLIYVHIHALLGQLVASWVVLLKIFNIKKKNARYFSIASMTLIAGSVLGIFMIHYLHLNAGIYLVQAAVILEIFVFLFGLGYGIFIKETYRRKIQDNLIAQLQQNEKLQYKLNRELEEMVHERTAEIEQQKNKLEELNFIKDKLFSIISHDLRSPLTSLQGSLQALHLGLLNKEEEKSIYYLLNHKLHYTKNLLDNLLYWAMIQMEKVITRFEEIDMHLLVEEVIRGFQESNSKNIHIQNLMPKECFAYADRNMILIVVRNLLSNAVKFTPEQGEVKILSNITDNTLEITVEDNGIGMVQEEIEKLFKLDTHFSKPGTELERGTGLGLLLCKEFVLKNEGKIFMESQKGKGSKVTFTLQRKTNLVKDKSERYGFSYVILV